VSRIAAPYTPHICAFPANFQEKLAGAAEAAARRGMLAEMRSPRRSVALFSALVTTLLAEFFLLVWRVQGRPVLAVIAAILFAVAAVIWVVAILRLRRR
jgi:hypothetical protein